MAKKVKMRKGFRAEPATVAAAVEKQASLSLKITLDGDDLDMSQATVWHSSPALIDDMHEKAEAIISSLGGSDVQTMDQAREWLKKLFTAWTAAIDEIDGDIEEDS